MLIDLLILSYIVLLFPLFFECERLPYGGYKILLTGAVLTPFVGYAYLAYHKRKIQPKD